MSSKVFEAAGIAKRKGFALAVKSGQFRFELHTPKKDGSFNIKPVSEWMRACDVCDFAAMRLEPHSANQ